MDLQLVLSCLDQPREVAHELLEAAESGEAAAVRWLLEAGADIHASDHMSRTALMLASAKGHTLVVRELLEAGATKDTRDRYLRDTWK